MTHESDGRNEERESGAQGPPDGWARGLEFLGSLKETIEEALGDARGRSDLNVDRAANAVRDAVRRAQEATSEARERFDFVPRDEFDRLVARVEELERRLGGDPGAPERPGSPRPGTGDAGDGTAGAAQADGVP
jgi:hypothetical protein